MPDLVTLALLIQRARERADMVSNGFISATVGPEDEHYIQQSAKALHSLLVEADPDFYTVVSAMTTTDPTFAIWDFPTTPGQVYKIRKITYNYAGWDRVVRRLDLEDFIRYSNITGSTYPAGYYIHGQTVRFAPALSGATPAPRMWFVEQQPTLAVGPPLISFDAREGWAEWIVLDAAIKMLMKEESDARPLQLERDQVLQRILAQSADRDLGEPPKIIDTDQAAWDAWPPPLPPP